MEEKKFKVIWRDEIIASAMRLSDAFILIRGLCEKYFNESVDIRLVQEERPCCGTIADEEEDEW